MTLARNVYTRYPLDWYKLYFGLDVNEKTVSKAGTLSLKLPSRFNEIAHDIVAFCIKFGKPYIFTKRTEIKLALIPEEEAAELVARSGMNEIHKIIAVW